MSGMLCTWKFSNSKSSLREAWLLSESSLQRHTCSSSCSKGEMTSCLLSASLCANKFLWPSADGLESYKKKILHDLSNLLFIFSHGMCWGVHSCLPCQRGRVVWWWPSWMVNGGFWTPGTGQPTGHRLVPWQQRVIRRPIARLQNGLIQTGSGLSWLHRRAGGAMRQNAALSADAAELLSQSSPCWLWA